MNLLWDAGTGTTGYKYDNADRVIWTTNQLNLTTRTEYNSRGWVTNVTEPDNGTVSSEYFNTGEFKKQYGARTYPVEYTYDYAGRMKTMKTWQNFAANSGTAITTWTYDANRGFITNKAYADATQVGYTYTSGGRLKMRGWARGVYITNHYDNAGTLTNLTYSDSTPSVTRTLDRLGRVNSIVHGTNTTEYQYGVANQVLSEKFTAGMLSGLTVSNLYDSLHRRVTNGLVNSSGTWLTLQTNRWSFGRMSGVSDGSTRVTWSFKENSPLIASMTHWEGSTIRAGTMKTYDNLNRLTKMYMTNQATGALISSNAYAYNAVNQRTSVTNTEGRWAYTYDTLGQVTSGKKYWSEGVPVAGQQSDYNYDDIGNRRYAGEGGNEWGTGLRYEQYTVNTVNQYTQRTVPGYVDVLGTAKTNATITVNDTATYRKADYFRGELPVTNDTAPIWISLTNLAVLKDGANPDITTNFVGNEFVPKNPETFTYDLDGNQTSDGRWTNRWDAENRLISVESHSSAPDGSKYKIIFAYDSQWRRTSKIVSNWVGGAWALSRNIRFAYDGWNLIAELNATNYSVINSYLWGLDLSGTTQGAGGVGGLLAIKSTGNGTHFTAFDGNGNITALASVTNASLTAQYEYDPFSNLLRETGPIAKANDFTGSTKRSDREIGAYYYGHRYLRNGRWLSRDPINERGGMHLYAFVWNRPSVVVDSNGLQGFGVILLPRLRPYPDGSYDAGEEALHKYTRPPRENEFKTDVDDIAEANKKLRMISSCKCISTLNIHGHSFRVGSKAKDTIPNLPAPSNTIEGSVVPLFNGVKFCANCAITLRGCMCGAGDAAQAVLKSIREVTGCSVYAFSFLTQAGADDGLSGIDPTLGFQTGPDVIFVAPPRPGEYFFN